MTEVTVTLPDDLVQQARKAGLLRPEALAALLRHAMREGRIERLFSTLDKVAQLEPPLTEEEIAAEIAAAPCRTAQPTVAMTRTVVDTNIVVSTFLWGGNARAILDAAKSVITAALIVAGRALVRDREGAVRLQRMNRREGQRTIGLEDHAMNAQAEKALLEKLKTLPPARLAQVEDFVDFLKTRDERARDEAAQRLGEAFAKLNALNAPPLTSDEVQGEIDTARAERRGRADPR